MLEIQKLVILSTLQALAFRVNGVVMEQIERILNKGYAVIRCHDGAIVARLNTFPDNKRALMYRHGGEVSFMTLQENEIVGTPTLFTLMLERAGYRIVESASQSKTNALIS